MDRFEEFLNLNKGKYMSIITPGGNHGDTLIHMGLIKKLREYEISYTCFNLEKMYEYDLLLTVKYLLNIGFWKINSNLSFKLFELPPNTELILFEGGGYMNDIWFGPTLLKNVIKYYKSPIAIAPQSFLLKSTNLENYFLDGRKVDIFCREKYSYEHLKNKIFSNNVTVSLSPELALYLTKDDLGEYIEEKSGNYQLLAFRNDKESMIEEVTKKELLKISSNPIISDISMKKTLKDFISIVNNADYIYTDRLHVAILSKILGKDVTLFGNKYHKNKGVWEYSLKNYIKYIEPP
jgi:exopolysaccharide biosynthesis predicted pyruvyltransferase EpsI